MCLHTHTHTHTYIYIYLNVCVYVCVCVYMYTYACVGGMLRVYLTYFLIIKVQGLWVMGKNISGDKYN